MEDQRSQSSELTRRDCLRAACGLAATTVGPSIVMAADKHAASAPAPKASTLPALGNHATTPPVREADKSIVVHLQAQEVLSGAKVHPSLAGEMIDETLKTLTRRGQADEAWHALLKSDDSIAIKFNRVGAEALGTTVSFGLQLVDSLTRAGFAPDRIMLIEAPDELIRLTKTRRPIYGWSGPEVSFGSGSEQLAAWLDEVTAIINVPFLKSHNIAGMSGSLKNLSHALIRRPARYHANGCAPYVGDIVALPQIRSKIRLHLVNALKAVFDAGPEARYDTMWPHHAVIAGTDGVAVDTVGLDILNDKRRALRLGPLSNAAGHIPYLHAAAERGLGTDDQDYITLLEPRPF